MFIFLSGCATASGPLFSGMPKAEATKGMVLIYRENTIYVYTPTIKFDDKPFVKLSKKGYSYASLYPGLYKLVIDYPLFETSLITEINVEEGKELFLRLYDNGFGKSLTEIEKEKAIDELKEYHFVEPINSNF
jgi:hypothetical protein